MSEETKICGKCRQPSIQACKECFLLYCYKCEEQEHWKKCKSVNVCRSDNGWCLKAARDLSPGEIVCSELPLAAGPKLPHKNGCVPCVGCCRVVSSSNISFCPDCLWPLCSKNCDGLKNDATHAQECAILSKHKSDFSKVSLQNYRFGVLLPLRVVLQYNDQWENFRNQLENNDVPPKNNDLEYLKTILPKDEKLALLEKIFTYLQRNCLEIDDCQLLYPSLGFVRHSCTPNTFRIFSRTDFRMTLRARSTIVKDTPITVSFVDVYQGTHERQSQVSGCECERCSDPTEFGTFFSALKCLGTRTEPCGGTQLPKEPTKSGTVWVCDVCGIELPNDQMVKFVQHLGGEVAKVVGTESVEELEELLAKLLMFLHPNHFHVCRVKRALIGRYSLEETKIGLIESLVEIYRKLYDGGVVLGELYHEMVLAKLRNGEEVSHFLDTLRNNMEAAFDEDFSEKLSKLGVCLVNYK